VFVLLGITGSGKSSTGNMLLERENAFPVGHLADSCTQSPHMEEGLASHLNVPVVVIDTPGYGDSGGNDEGNIQKMITFLENEIHFVNTFLLVLNGAQRRFDQQTFEMLKVYSSVFGPSFFDNMTVVVTHWEMSVRANKQREKDGITQANYQKAWVEALSKRMDISSCDSCIPFVFMDNYFDTEDELETQIFIDAKNTIYNDACENPLFPCANLNANPEVLNRIQREAEIQGLEKCDLCGRYFFCVLPKILTTDSAASSTTAVSAQAAIATARINRVVAATAIKWDPDVVLKAMTRGWNARTGVHLFGKVASVGGVVIQLGVGIFRICKAKTWTERAQAAVGTGASIAAGFQGASVGAAVGTALCPGVGTIVGGIVGGLAGSVGAQLAGEALVGYVGAKASKRLCSSCQKT